MTWYCIFHVGPKGFKAKHLGLIATMWLAGLSLWDVVSRFSAQVYTILPLCCWCPRIARTRLPSLVACAYMPCISISQPKYRCFGRTCCCSLVSSTACSITYLGLKEPNLHVTSVFDDCFSILAWGLLYMHA